MYHYLCLYIPTAFYIFNLHFTLNKLSFITIPMNFIMIHIFLLAIISGFSTIHPIETFQVVIEAEESVYTFENANNGAGPMWTHGNTCIVRYKNKVFASGIETLKDVKPLHNTRWMLFERNRKGWKLLLKDPKDRTREPCPLGLMQDGRMYLSANPTLTEPGKYNGPAEPQIFQFDAKHPENPYKIIKPAWKGSPAFTEHSYRTFATDSKAEEMILFQNIGYTHAEWSFMDADGEGIAHGQLNWPPGDYEEPIHGAIRVCYPAVQLKNKSVYYLGVSDITEPRKDWRNYKFKLTGRKWDYDFRRLFYTWSKDITKGKFEKWIEVSSRENTGGNIFPADLWVSPENQVYILWYERALDERLWKDFFPEENQSESLNFAIIKDGKVIFRKSIVTSATGEEVPGWARFQITDKNRLFVFYYVHGGPGDIRENRMVEISLTGDHEISPPVKVNVKRPLSIFYSANVRAGSPPSSIMDIYGRDDSNEMRYIRLKIK
jgi:hypothetical protein